MVWSGWRRIFGGAGSGSAPSPDAAAPPVRAPAGSAGLEPFPPPLQPPPSRPARLLRGAIDADDYPQSALHDGAEGRTVVSFLIDATGRVCEAQTVESSGRSDLDHAACALIEERFVFEPARDGAGNPIASRFRQAIRWQLPEAADDETLPDWMEELMSILTPSSPPPPALPAPPPLPPVPSVPAPLASVAAALPRAAEATTPWRVLSARRESIEVFRMTNEDRTVMDLVRLADGRVELCREALDGPGWIYDAPPPMGITEEGTSLWEWDGDRGVVDTNLRNLPRWAEVHRASILAYLTEKMPPPRPPVAPTTAKWFHLSPNRTIRGPYSPDGVSWLDESRKLNAGEAVTTEDADAIGYVTEVVGYEDGNPGNPRERGLKYNHVKLGRLDADFADPGDPVELPSCCTEERRTRYAVYAITLTAGEVAKLCA